MSDLFYRVRRARNQRRSGLSRRLASRPDKSRPRLVVRVSHKHIQAQIIDDVNNKTLVSASTLKQSFKKGETGLDRAQFVGAEIGKKGVEAGISKVTFDKGSKIYHGRVKAVAEGAREQGLIF